MNKPQRAINAWFSVNLLRSSKRQRAGVPMRKSGRSIAAVLLAAMSGVAFAAGWVSIKDRAAPLERRVDEDVRVGVLSRSQADEFHATLQNLEKLEVHYRYTGNRLSLRERADLDRRFAALGRSIAARRSAGTLR